MRKQGLMCVMALALTSAVLECRSFPKEQWGFPALDSGTAAIIRGQLLLTKGTYIYAKSADKLGLINIELTGAELYERKMTVRA